MASKVKPLLPGRTLVPHSGESFIQLKVLASPVGPAAGFPPASVFISAAGLAGFSFPGVFDAMLWPLETFLEPRWIIGQK